MKKWETKHCVRGGKWYPDQSFIASHAALPNFCSYPWGETQFLNIFCHTFHKGGFPSKHLPAKTPQHWISVSCSTLAGAWRASSSPTQPTATDNSEVTVCHKGVCVWDGETPAWPQMCKMPSCWTKRQCLDTCFQWFAWHGAGWGNIYHDASLPQRCEDASEWGQTEGSNTSLLLPREGHVVFSISCSLIVLYSHFSRLKKELQRRPVWVINHFLTSLKTPSQGSSPNLSI